MESIEVSGIIPAAPERVYDGWLNSREHTSFTGGSKAEIDPNVGGKFTAFDGWISGSNLELKKNRKIVQAWRTTEFPPEAPDSRLEIQLKRRDDGTTEIAFLHSDIPPGHGTRLQNGWVDFYLTPMRMYFGELANMERKNADKMAQLEAHKVETEEALRKAVAAAPKRLPPPLPKDSVPKAPKVAPAKAAPAKAVAKPAPKAPAKAAKKPAPKKAPAKKPAAKKPAPKKPAKKPAPKKAAKKSKGRR